MLFLFAAMELALLDSASKVSSRTRTVAVKVESVHLYEADVVTKVTINEKRMEKCRMRTNT